MFTPADTYRFAFCTVNTSGVLTNADSTPQGTLVINGVNSGATVTIASSATGDYRGSVSLAGTTNNDEFYVLITAIMGGVTQKAYTKTERVGVNLVQVNGENDGASGLKTIADYIIQDDSIPANLIAANDEGTTVTGPQLNTLINRVDVAVSSVSGGSGTGTTTQTITVRRSDTNALIPNAVIRYTAGGYIRQGVTNASGVATVGVDPGNYTLTISGENINHTPEAITISSTGSISRTVTIWQPQVSTDPVKTNAWTYCYDLSGTIVQNAKIEIQMVLPRLDNEAATAGESWGGNVKTLFSDSNGLVTTTLARNCKYRARRDSGNWVDFTTNNDASYALPETLGILST